MRKIHFTDKYLLSPYHPVTVLVAGAGGTGSQVITNLARMSVALQALGHPGLHLTAFDPDTVTEANIGRQLFSETELGLNKATALVTRVNRFFGYAWEARECRYPIITKEGDKSVPLANIIITCTDNTRSRLDLWRFLKKYREYKNNDEKASRVYDVSKITPLSIKNFFSNNYTYGIMSGVGKNTTMKIYIGVRINE